MSEHAHSMPFGAEIMDDRRVRFRLWAPGARRVELCLEGPRGQTFLPMEKQADGWLELVTDEAGPGSLYRYRIDGEQLIPDPASRHQPRDVHGPSEVIDPGAFQWRENGWRGRPWEESVFYELHVGTFCAEGTFRGVAKRLDYLADLGVTAIELMPVSDFPGRRNWGYDGVLPFAPDSSYGRPEDLKALIQAAHQRGLMVFLDVVYNHFGPEGNYLGLYAPQFFTERHHTPWGAAINFDGERSRTVRDFFIHNALYWLNEYRFDGLRLDAVHAIIDESRPDLLIELAEAVHADAGAERAVHLVLENDDNAARYLRRRADGKPLWYAAQWNDDFHHAAHLLVTGESDGYYSDYAREPAGALARSLAEGFIYQGEPSTFRDGVTRGEPSGDLPDTAFVDFVQNHDQVGNRALGDRIGSLASPEALRAILSILLLSPSPPLLFMGEEWMSKHPFLFFCDFGDDLAQAVTEGRRREFARFERCADPDARALIPDPNDAATFLRSKLDWSALDSAVHRDWLRFHRALLALRRREIMPRLHGLSGDHSGHEPIGERGLRAHWILGDGSRLSLIANLGERELVQPGLAGFAAGTALHCQPEGANANLRLGVLPAWSVLWHLDTGAPGEALDG